MKKNADPKLSMMLSQGHKDFFHKGTSRKWEGVLSDDLVKEYEDMAEAQLGKECAFWLATGRYLPKDKCRGVEGN